MADHFNQDGKSVDGDMNFNGHVDLADFVAFRAVYEAQSAQAAAVPEPSSALLALLTALSLVPLIRRRRR